ncbi:hypothetical protein Bbelb_401550 [Branchiostoma belcheri]|nr:hypothetical protein Bbelb_401550 [Branchiostoma belcheri]
MCHEVEFRDIYLLVGDIELSVEKHVSVCRVLTNKTLTAPRRALTLRFTHNQIARYTGRVILMSSDGHTNTKRSPHYSPVSTRVEDVATHSGYRATKEALTRQSRRFGAHPG